MLHLSKMINLMILYLSISQNDKSYDVIFCDIDFHQMVLIKAHP